MIRIILMYNILILSLCYNIKNIILHQKKWEMKLICIQISQLIPIRGSSKKNIIQYLVKKDLSRNFKVFIISFNLCFYF